MYRENKVENVNQVLLTFRRCTTHSVQCKTLSPGQQKVVTYEREVDLAS